MFRLTMFTMVVASLVGCSSEGSQTIAGRISTSTFPEPVTAVRAVGNEGVYEARVAGDGAFSITLPAGDRYRLEMVSAVRTSTLVFPRRTGTIDTSLYIAGSGEAFALGSVRYVRDPIAQTYTYDGNCIADDGSICTQDGSQDTGTGGGADSGSSCGDADAPDGGSTEDAAVAESSPADALNCDDGSGGDGDTGGGGQDTGGGGQDTGTGGGGG